MRASAKRPVKLILFAVAFVAIVASLLFTPLGGWLTWGTGSVWQGFLNLPGIVWARQQMASGGAAEEGDASSAEAATINEILKEGQALQEAESYDEAMQRYRQALKLDEEYAPTHMALASVYLQLGREDDGLEELEKATALAPDNPIILAQLGQLYLKREDSARAVDALERGREVDPEEAVIRYWLGVAYHHRSYADAENAVAELERAVELEPDQAEIHHYLAMAYVRRDDDPDKQRAIQALEKAVELDPSQAESLYYLGQLYVQVGEPDAAAAAWRDFLDLSDDAETVEKVGKWLRNLEGASEPGSVP